MSVQIKYFVHGTTTDNLEKKATGWLPGILSDKGINQGVELAKTIENEHFDVVFCSDLKRAVESSKLNFYNRDIEIIKDARLRECNYGDFNGQDSKLVNYNEHISKPFPNGESMLDVEKRIKDFLVYLNKNFDGKKVAIVAHRAPQLAIEVLTMGKTWEQALADDWRNTKNWQPGWKYEINSFNQKELI